MIYTTELVGFSLGLHFWTTIADPKVWFIVFHTSLSTGFLPEGKGTGLMKTSMQFKSERFKIY